MANEFYASGDLYELGFKIEFLKSGTAKVFDQFVQNQVSSGRHKNVSEVFRAGL